MKLSIYSRAAVENLIEDAFPENTAVISFYDPPSSRTPAGYAPVDYTDLCDVVFPVGEFDIDIESVNIPGATDAERAEIKEKLSEGVYVQ